MLPVIRWMRSDLPGVFQDYDLYMETLQRLMTYPTRAVGVAQGSHRGAKVAEFYRRTLEAAEQAFDFIADRLDQGADDDELAEELYQRFIRGGMAYYSRDTMLGSEMLLIRSVRRKLEGN